jgi:hypothetical protein
MALPVKMTYSFGVLEYWSIGVLEKAKTRISTGISHYHYSSVIPHKGKTLEPTAGVGTKLIPWFPDSLLNG